MDKWMKNNGTTVSEERLWGKFEDIGTEKYTTTDNETNYCASNSHPSTSATCGML